VAATADPKEADFEYVEFLGEAYKGNDQVTGDFLNCVRGDVVRCSHRKRAQLKADFPAEWRKSDRDAYDKAAESRQKRSAALAAKIVAEEGKRAKEEKVRAAMAAGGNDPDDEPQD
jgi:hypothetical protein